MPARYPEPMTGRPASARTTALGALTIFLPLAGVLIWWAIVHMVDPDNTGSLIGIGTLPARAAVLAALLAAAGPAVLTALFLAKLGRLRAIMTPTRQHVGLAMFLALLTPVATVQWLPFTSGMFMVVGLVRGPVSAWLVVAGAFALLTLAWYPAVSLVAGVRHRSLRLAVFAFVWWSIYGTVLLAQGYRGLGF